MMKKDERYVKGVSSPDNTDESKADEESLAQARRYRFAKEKRKEDKRKLIHFLSMTLIGLAFAILFAILILGASYLYYGGESLVVQFLGATAGSMVGSFIAYLVWNIYRHDI